MLSRRTYARCFQLMLISSILALELVGCGWQVRGTGIPVSRAERFFFYISAAARDRGLTALPGEGGLTVLVGGGDMLHYSTGAVEVDVTLAPKRGARNDLQLKERRKELYALHLSLLAEARRRALADRGF